MTRIVVPLCLLFVLFGGCRKSTPTNSFSSEEARTPARPRIDPCALLDKEEIGKIQNTTIIETKGSNNSDGILFNSQCYYSAALASASVSVAVTQADPTKRTGQDVRSYWEKTFGAFRGDKADEKEKEKPESGRDGEEKQVPPVKVPGIGEEAFWTADRVSGALYVLKNDVFIRISVGGPGTLENKMDKSKLLAAKALTKL